MTVTTEEFKQHILESGYVLDPEGVHHEFVSGMHGRKLDFDLIPDESALFEEWVGVAAETMHQLYTAENLNRLAVLSVANGTNRLVEPVVEALGKGTIALLTKKESAKSVKLSTAAEGLIRAIKLDLIVAIEDVGTTGSTTATAITAAREAGAKRVEALTTWQRRPQLEALEDIAATYNAVIKDILPTYTPEECGEAGYCAQGWEFIPRPVT